MKCDYVMTKGGNGVLRRPFSSVCHGDWRGMTFAFCPGHAHADEQDSQHCALRGARQARQRAVRSPAPRR